MLVQLPAEAPEAQTDSAHSGSVWGGDLMQPLLRSPLLSTHAAAAQEVQNSLKPYFRFSMSQAQLFVALC